MISAGDEALRHYSTPLQVLGNRLGRALPAGGAQAGDPQPARPGVEAARPGGGQHARQSRPPALEGGDAAWHQASMALAAWKILLEKFPDREEFPLEAARALFQCDHDEDGQACWNPAWKNSATPSSTTAT
ncbi:MAG: hypothetical protein U1F87_00840 [Kiritimatiellia bacterium]